MRICISSGVGEGPTPLAAFDAALRDAGVSNYNLICLSSVIPPGSEVVQTPYPPQGDEYGHCLYVVMAERRESEPGKSACAGLGWTQAPHDGRGLFVEIAGSEESDVARRIDATLADMTQHRPYAYGPIRHLLAGIRCTDRPVCALVLAAYESQSWKA